MPDPSKPNAQQEKFLSDPQALLLSQFFDALLKKHRSIFSRERRKVTQLKRIQKITKQSLSSEGKSLTQKQGAILVKTFLRIASQETRLNVKNLRKKPVGSFFSKIARFVHSLFSEKKNKLHFSVKLLFEQELNTTLNRDFFKGRYFSSEVELVDGAVTEKVLERMLGFGLKENFQTEECAQRFKESLSKSCSQDVFSHFEEMKEQDFLQGDPCQTLNQKLIENSAALKTLIQERNQRVDKLLGISSSEEMQESRSATPSQRRGP